MNSTTNPNYKFVSNGAGNKGWASAFLTAMVVFVIWTSFQQTNVSVTEFWKGAPYFGAFLARMYPPNWEYLPKLLGPALQTIQIAIAGTVLAILLAVPVCFLAARNLSPHPFIHRTVKQFLNITRGINELILALIFVAAVGLGPFPGVLALGIHGAGMLGKFFAEAIEEVDRGQVEGVRSTGASMVQTIIFSVLPQVTPSWIAVSLYRFETNLRQATVLGMVGAGGIGYELTASMKLFQYQETATCILVIIAMVMAADAISSYLRGRILGDAKA